MIHWESSGSAFFPWTERVPTVVLSAWDGGGFYTCILRLPASPVCSPHPNIVASPWALNMVPCPTWQKVANSQTPVPDNLSSKGRLFFFSFLFKADFSLISACFGPSLMLSNCVYILVQILPFLHVGGLVDHTAFCHYQRRSQNLLVLLEAF